MKITKKIIMVSLSACFIAANINIPGWAGNAYAAKISSANQAKAKALEKVPDATITEVDSDYEKGVLVYDVELVKGNKEYNITYRASDAKILEYEWEKIYVSPSRNKSIIKESKCRTLAQNKVKDGTINSIVKKTDDGVDIYKVKMSDDHRTYTLKFHARTGSLIEYDWKFVKSSSKNNTSSSNTADGYIGIEEAKQIALDDAGSDFSVIKAEFDTDDGIAVYEVELVNGNYEYEYKINAKTGKILEKETDWDD